MTRAPVAGVGAIRIEFGNGRGRDPLTAACEQLTGEFYPTNQWRRAAAALGVPRRAARALVRAADGGYGSAYEALRGRLLGAAGF